MKYLRILSDLHLEFDHPESGHVFFPKPTEQDKDTVLVIAGDLWYGTQVLDIPLSNKTGNNDIHSNDFLNSSSNDKMGWLQQLASQFGAIILTLGNHDFWYNNLDHLPDQFKQKLEQYNLNNVYLLQNDCCIIDQTLFIGSTLWTNYNHGDPMAEWAAYQCLPDFSHIMQGSNYDVLTVENLKQKHQHSVEYIFNKAQKTKDIDNIVVVTHHSPCELSVDAKFKQDPTACLINHAFFSDLSHQIMDSAIDLWIHGHMHNQVDYMLGETRIINNPRGYPMENNQNHDDCYRLSLNHLKKSV